MVIVEMGARGQSKGCVSLGGGQVVKEKAHKKWQPGGINSKGGQAGVLVHTTDGYPLLGS